MRAAEWRVRLRFGFLPNLALSTHKNAREVMGHTSPGCYFLKAMNTTFHDLTGGGVVACGNTISPGAGPQIHPYPSLGPLGIGCHAIF